MVSLASGSCASAARRSVQGADQITVAGGGPATGVLRVMPRVRSPGRRSRPSGTGCRPLLSWARHPFSGVLSSATGPPGVISAIVPATSSPVVV